MLQRISHVLQRSHIISVATMGSIALALTSCTTLVVQDYEATAVTTYIWQVDYEKGDRDRPIDHRLQRFASTSLTNVNGIKPEAAVVGPDDKGLWWPALPPQPTVDELEANQKLDEKIGEPELIKQVEYSLAFNQAGTAVNLPTNYNVYRQAVKATEGDRALELTLGPAEGSVQNAEIR